MASNYNQPIRHCADPHHLLWPTQYRHDEEGLCNICLLKLAGVHSSTYGCYYCNIHLHSECAHYFPETISFFAHPAHTLKLRRSPGRVCDICRGDCPLQSFVYSCTGCGFDVHPLCWMLPERITSPLDPEHQLCMLSSESPGSCSACRHPLSRWQWHYIGSSSLKLHIACVTVYTPTIGATGGNGHAAAAPVVHGAPGSYAGGSAAVVQGSYGGAVSHRSLFGAPTTGPAGTYPVHQGYGHASMQAGNYYAPPIHGIYYYVPPSSGQHQSISQNPTSLMSVIARFLFGTAISAVASDLLSELLSGSLS